MMNDENNNDDEEEEEMNRVTWNSIVKLIGWDNGVVSSAYSTV